MKLSKAALKRLKKNTTLWNNYQFLINYRNLNAKITNNHHTCYKKVLVSLLQRQVRWLEKLISLLIYLMLDTIPKT